MKAISLWQPWASAIALGAKRIETRSWSTSYRGPIAIHAAKTGLGCKVAMKHERDLWIDILGVEGGLLAPALRSLPFGAVVAVAELVDCRRAEDCDATIIHQGQIGEWAESQVGDFRPGRWGWLLRNVRELPHPIPCRGRQQLFDVEIPMELVP